MKTILLDCDGVICDFVGGINDYFRKNEIPTFEPHAIKSYDMCDYFTEEQKLAFERAKQNLSARDLSWYAGAKDFVRSLQAIGHVVIVTAAWDPVTWCHDRNGWLADVIHKNDVLYVPAQHKHLIRGDALIEDNAKTLIQWAGDVKILISRPWNEYSMACDRYRYTTYAGIVDQLERVL